MTGVLGYNVLVDKLGFWDHVLKEFEMAYKVMLSMNDKAHYEVRNGVCKQACTSCLGARPLQQQTNSKRHLVSLGERLQQKGYFTMGAFPSV